MAHAKSQIESTVPDSNVTSSCNCNSRNDEPNQDGDVGATVTAREGMDGEIACTTCTERCKKQRAGEMRRALTLPRAMKTMTKILAIMTICECHNGNGSGVSSLARERERDDRRTSQHQAQLMSTMHKQRQRLCAALLASDKMATEMPEGQTLQHTYTHTHTLAVSPFQPLPNFPPRELQQKIQSACQMITNSIFQPFLYEDGLIVHQATTL